MSDYTITTDFSVKDNLASGDAAKVIKGSDIDTELTAISTAIATKVESGDIPSGSAMVFFQAAAPSGWTKSTANTDKALRVTSGSGGGTGGSVAFETAFASKSVGGNIAGNAGATTLQTAQIPGHTHTVGLTGDNKQSGNRVANSTQGGPGTTTTSSTGGGGSHTHAVGNLAFTGTAIDLDVKFVDVILASKD